LRGEPENPTKDSQDFTISTNSRNNFSTKKILWYSSSRTWYFSGKLSF